MKVRKQALHITGAIAGAGLCLSLYIIWDHHRKDKLAAILLQELNKILNPSTSGLSSEVGFDISYAEEMIRKIKGVLLLKADTAGLYAKDIYSAWSFFGDDENKVYAVFRSLKDKVQVSQVAKAYNSTFKVNLIDELKGRLTDSELTPILNMVRTMPPYRVVK